MEEIKEVNGVKVGDWIRTTMGHIGKVKRIELDKIDKNLKWIVYDHKEFEINIVNEEYINKPFVVNYSQNIIDLIEVGDYVNGYKVYDISTEYLVDINKDGKILYIEKEGFINATITEGKDDIKSICTKEQFENVEYRLED